MSLRVAVVGAGGFVGSSFGRYLRRRGTEEIVSITRETYTDHVGQRFDVVIDASGNSSKRLADRDPLRDFDLSVSNRLRTLRDFPADMHVHVSSVDVYSDLTSFRTTSETGAANARESSNYGFHKLLAESLVRHHASRWIIVRLAGMVGEGLRKNPVYDILHDQPLYIHPDSQYQFMSTDDVARITMDLVDRGLHGEIVNVCGDGLVSPREIAAIAGRKFEVSEEVGDSGPRIVDINIGKLGGMMAVPKTITAVTDFVRQWNRERAGSDV